MTANVVDRKAKKRSKYDRKPEKSKPRCTHFWVIESPKGAASKGVCKYCGLIKEFMNEPPSLFYPGVFWQCEISDAGEDGEDEPG